MSAENLLNDFLTKATEEGELNSEYFLCPEFDKVSLEVKDWEVKAGTSTKNAENVEKPWAMLILRYKVDSEEARQKVKRDEVLVKSKPVFLSVNDDLTLNLDSNQQLARTLKIFELEMQGTLQELFDSFIGCYVEGQITHRPMENKEGVVLDEEGNTIYIAEVNKITKS